MRSGRILAIIGVLILVGALAVGLVLWRRTQQTPEGPSPDEEEGTSVPYAPPEGMREIVVAAQDVPRGRTLGEDTVYLASWPEEAIPTQALTDTADVYGKVTKVNLVRESPVLRNALTERGTPLEGEGSETALQVPSGKVGYVLPVDRYTSVAWGIAPGDHVAIMISTLLIDLDEEFQSPLPNQFERVSVPEEEGGAGGVLGRLEALPNGWMVNLTPSESQHPRLVTQMVIQDAQVLRVGDWGTEQEAPAGRGETVEEEGEETEAGQQTQPEDTTTASVKPLTLAVTPQEALMLRYIQDMGANIDVVVRSAGETQALTTDAVTLGYLMDTTNTNVPPKLPYGVTPSIQSLKPGSLGNVDEPAGDQPES